MGQGRFLPSLAAAPAETLARYPRLHHANVALRTAYLDREVAREGVALGVGVQVCGIGREVGREGERELRKG